MSSSVNSSRGARAGRAGREGMAGARCTKTTCKHPMSVSSSIPRYKFVNRILETHNAPIYYVQFNFSDLRYKDYFATIGSNFASIYKLEPQGIITPIYIFADADSNEQLYTCCWTSDTTTGDPLLVIAGNNGTIKVLNIHTCSMEKALLGHGAGVYELQRHPLDPRVIMSASQDGSARLWNLESGRCFVSFVGEQGHREAVLSCAFNLKGDRCATAGMDHMIKIWDLEILAPQIKRSRLPVRYPGSAEVSPLDSKVTDSNDLNEQDPPITIVQFPLFSTSKVHNNYVDCVRFMGDWILSKSAGQKIVLWRPLGSRGSYTVDRLQEYVFKECDIWFVRFGLDYRQRFLAVGNKVGDLFIWDAADVLANALQGRLCEGMQLSHKRATRAVRHVAFSFDCSSLLAVCEDGTLWRYDAPGKNSEKNTEQNAEQNTDDMNTEKKTERNTSTIKSEREPKKYKSSASP